VIHCSQARDWFGAYWDDEITQAERESLEAHFVSCAGCRREYEEFARTLEVIGSLPRHEVAPDFAERTLARIRRTASAPDRLLQPQRPAWVPIAAAATVLAIAATLLAPGIVSRGRAPSPVATRITVPAEPQLTAPNGAASITAHAGQSTTAVAAMVDSVIDHSEDVDFVLDPVRVSRGRTATNPYVGPVQGQQAVITF